MRYGLWRDGDGAREGGAVQTPLPMHAYYMHLYIMHAYYMPLYSMHAYYIHPLQ